MLKEKEDIWSSRLLRQCKIKKTLQLLQPYLNGMSDIQSNLY